VCPWFLSALLLLTNTKHLLAMLDAKRNHEHSSDIPAYIIKDRLTASALAFSTSICIFCVQCVWVIWPRLFRGERHSSISKIVANEGRMLVDPRHPRLGLPFINIVFWLPYYLYVVRITVWLHALLVVTHTVTVSENTSPSRKLPLPIHRRLRLAQ
jgi:hypothetical protein